MFKCTRCGVCCMSLKNVELYKELDRGDGICKNFNIETKLCDIYESRPLVCRVDDFYDAFLKEEMSKEEYYEMNYKACRFMQKNR